MKTSEQKKLILNVLRPFFKEHKIKGKNEWALLYQFKYKHNTENILKGGIFFSNYEPPVFIPQLIICSVEDIIWEIKFPNQSFEDLKISDYPFGTLKNTGEFSRLIESKSFKFTDENSYKQFAYLITNYLQKDTPKIIETYSYLPNVLKKMDELTAEGKTWQNKGRGILSGALDAQFRGLIISKLCNDPNFEEKIKMCNEIFSREQYKAWLPYYEKLKERLKSVEPKYNV